MEPEVLCVPAVAGETAEQLFRSLPCPASGYSFSNWTGTGTGSYSAANDPASIMMGGPITENAVFIHN